ncbi:hypothetical protein [uncultured Megasphaera sp.]|uniref:hypothetical protein n=1 Tax=uncultured Megasphaera sp. TaxID=165188 RepID=UPI00206A09DD|nr:hypothetical protein [uncultured Megasphaera sp.]DAQ39079.1 MAG TPA: hypothetical protein [Caudoviricetes sp.]
MNILGTLLSFVVKSALEKRKEKLKEELQAEIDTTQSAWVKIRNQGYLALLDNAGPLVVQQIEKELKKH